MESLVIQPKSRPAVALTIVLFIVVLAAFSRAVGFSFVELDDQRLVGENPLLQNPTRDSLIQFWSGPHEGLYAPLTYTVWWVFAALGRAGPGPLHVINILLHAGATGLVFSILRRCIRRDFPAFIGACLFALHPMQIESVAWISEMDNVLAGALGLAAIRIYLAAADAAPPKSALRFGVATIFFALALLAKPTATVVPIIVVALDVAVIRTPLPRAILRAFPWFCLDVPFLLIAPASQPAVPEPPWVRPFVALDALGFYLGKMFVPFGLEMDYNRPPLRVWVNALWIYTAAAAVAIGILLWVQRRSTPILALAGIIFVGALLPIIGLLPFSFQHYSTVADRYVYLAMLGLALAITQLPHRGLAILIILLLAVRCQWQLGVWKNSQTLTNHTLRIDPDNALANKIAALDFMRQGKYAQAIPFFRGALLRDPSGGTLHYNLACALQATDEPADAIDEYQRAIPLVGEALKISALDSMGVIYRDNGRPDLAREQFQKVLEIDPNNASASDHLIGLGAGGGVSSH